MAWYVYLAHFFGAALVANAIPHLNAGIAGRPLQSPFASPPFKGLSSPRVNVGWALINMAFAYLLLVRVAPFNLHAWGDATTGFAGFAAMALVCSRSFTRLRRQGID